MATTFQTQLLCQPSDMLDETMTLVLLLLLLLLLVCWVCCTAVTFCSLYARAVNSTSSDPEPPHITRRRIKPDQTLTKMSQNLG